MDILQEVMIWKRLSEAVAVRYWCLHDLQTDQYAVQSADYFRLPFDEKQFSYFEKQFVELFVEVPARERCDWFDSLREAIHAHDQEFS